MTQQTITPRESMELHEILSSKSLCLTKATSAISQVTDPQLKQILQDDITKTRTQITELKTLMQKSDLAKKALAGNPV
ncbi:MAG: hypothetical protein LKE46_12690 [Clostridium sp.]|jgi:similar to spore coat protein|uniref:hypothetical protein n=1 Tax=Clostridium sp. TaxID=1506 RepID=UPI0025C11907|nr:hypothetical protein [Clostridium sp.]MCH3965117.1 hypothetical protein [Clostridium sp.]MCI1714338.1 hypothetical protein [Clostridium sp.]MCI1798600.1 hypothetical protein [Clostridium sp.]MCI1812669.1 hypothetical protein [Clostridium sp.]MCI1869409.1 hypothetical protein [Clostridium sp.]